MNELDKNENYTNQSFEDIKHIDEESEKEANKANYEVGYKIRKTIKELGGTMLKNVKMKNTNGHNDVMELWEVLDDNGKI